MSAEILTIRGAPLPAPEAPFVPDPLTLESAERLLAEVKSGAIVGFGAIKLLPNGGYRTGWDTAPGADLVSLNAAAHMLAFRLTRYQAGGEE